MDEALRSKILEVLRRQPLMTLATIRPDGYPQATTLNYIHDDFILYFATDAASQKSGNIKLNNKVSVAIVDRAQDFYKLRGLSMSGTAVRSGGCQTTRGLRNHARGHGARRLRLGLRHDLCGGTIVTANARCAINVPTSRNDHQN